MWYIHNPAWSAAITGCPAQTSGLCPSRRKEPDCVSSCHYWGTEDCVYVCVCRAGRADWGVLKAKVTMAPTPAQRALMWLKHDRKTMTHWVLSLRERVQDIRRFNGSWIEKETLDFRSTWIHLKQEVNQLVETDLFMSSNAKERISMLHGCYCSGHCLCSCPWSHLSFLNPDHVRVSRHRVTWTSTPFACCHFQAPQGNC